MLPLHGLVEEPVTIISAHADEDGLDRLGEVEEFAASVAEPGSARPGHFFLRKCRL